MRARFFRTLLAAAEEDPRVWLLAPADGGGGPDRFRERFADRFVATDMSRDAVLEACGLAAAGKVAFVYGSALKATLRGLEALRSVAVAHDLAVKLVGADAGLLDGAVPGAAHAIDDVGLARALPGLAVVAPGDPAESAALTRALVDHPGPAYLRLAAGSALPVHAADVELEVGAGITVREGGELRLLASGGGLGPAVDAARLLERSGVSVGVLSLPSIAPLDAERVRQAARGPRALITVEEHSVTGGLGSAVAEVLAAMPGSAPLIRLGLPHRLPDVIGSRRHQLNRHRLTGAGVAEMITAILTETRGFEREPDAVGEGSA